MKNEGPTIYISARCTDCVHCVTERYAVQGDSGTDVYCGAMEKKPIGDTTWSTPYWCPYLAEAQRKAVEPLLANTGSAS